MRATNGGSLDTGIETSAVVVVEVSTDFVEGGE